MPGLTNQKADTLDFNNKKFLEWKKQNTKSHKIEGYSVVFVSLKSTKKPPGDATSQQMSELADISDKFSFGEVRVSHEQNLILPHVLNSEVFEVWKRLEEIDLATPNMGLITDTICCPGMDYCALATARSIPISQKISDHFESFIKQKEIGDLKIKISGCINACGHHHVGNIGILGLDRKGQEFYQITIGGAADENAAMGKIVGPSFSEEDLIPAIENIIQTYKRNRINKDDNFINVFKRIGINEFKKNLYDNTREKN